MYVKRLRAISIDRALCNKYLYYSDSIKRTKELLFPKELTDAIGSLTTKVERLTKELSRTEGKQDQTVGEMRELS